MDSGQLNMNFLKFNNFNLIDVLQLCDITTIKGATLVAPYKYTQSLPYSRLQNSRTYGGIIVHKWLQAYNQKVARYQDSFIICFYTSST